jgi:hypothetical protein
MPADARTRLARFRSFLLSRPVWVGAALLLLGVLLGCMSFSINSGGDECCHDDPPPPPNLPPGDVREQQGCVEVPANGHADVFYTVPYVSTPNLTLHGETEHVSLVMQRRDRFRVKNNGLFSRTVRWDANGVTIALNPPPPPPVPVTPVKASTPAGELPPEPIPVTVKEK